jgi:hypothetical protein
VRYDCGSGKWITTETRTEGNPYSYSYIRRWHVREVVDNEGRVVSLNKKGG